MKYKLGDLVETWDSWAIGIVVEVQVCGVEITLPRRVDDEYMYLINVGKANMWYFQSELKLVS
jgi:hypothetical protein